MADFSIVEFVIYGFIGYLGIALMMFQIIKYEHSPSKSLAVMRMVWIFPSIIALGMIIAIDGDIEFPDTFVTVVETENYEALNSADVVVTLNSTSVTTTTETNVMVLRDPVWGLFHLMLFLILIIYQITQMMLMFTNMGKKDTY